MGCEVTGDQTRQNLVLRNRSLDDEFTTASNQPCTMRQKIECLLAGTKPRGQEFGVNVEKHHRVGAVDAMQHRLGADEHRCTWIYRRGGG